MNSFVVLNEQNIVTAIVERQGELIDMPAGYVQMNEPVDPRAIGTTFVVEDGVLLPCKPRPNNFYSVWSAAEQEWIDPRTLDDLKAEKWEEVKAWRAQASIAPLMQTRFGIFDAGPQAMSDIKDTVAGLTAAAAIGLEPPTVRWTMADENPERYVTLTPNELREVGVQLLGRGNAAHERSRILFDEIEAAGTPEALAAIAWAVPT